MARTLTPNAIAQLVGLRAELNAFAEAIQNDTFVWLPVDHVRARFEGILDELELSADTEITAVITATGAKSTVPDDPTATDADIYVGGALVGAVTLRAAIEQPVVVALATWGDPEHWCSSELLEWAGAGLAELADPIVGAVRKAAARS